MRPEVQEKVKTIHTYNLGMITLCKSDDTMTFFVENEMADNQGFDSIIVEGISVEGDCVFPTFEHDGIGCEFCESHETTTRYCALLTDYINETNKTIQPKSVSYTRSICASCAYDFSESLKTAISKHFLEEFAVGNL